MSIIKIGKSEEEKMMERRTRISQWKAEIDRAIRQLEKNKEQNIQSAKLALKTGNMEKAKVFAGNIIMVESTIRGLNDYKLMLENINLTLQYAEINQKVWASLRKGQEDLVKSQLSEKQVLQMQQDMERIVNTSQRIQETLSSQLDMISNAVYENSSGNEERISKLLSSISGGQVKATESSAEDQELDKLIKALSEGATGEPQGQE
ncbi:hypothetical protein GCM10007108_16750 [Thermogymnomonas acidicola]|uniref:Uncharacterized protein n=1 Tax=Thermogymnomonas acidicola TaxID=399579 RepID=A0AA37BTG7_9ARCH|nr:Snf7 family protein [Thermogymnomonas acidicola]GGM79176.1 hypothetical protein GCM10007108_16750 [Thermogymnomonas acidicola]